MKLKLWITTLRPRVSTGEYPGGVRVSVHLSKRDALLDLCEWAKDDDVPEEDDEAEGIPDFPNAPEDELESYLEHCQEQDIMRSWGVEDFEIDLPGTATEQIAAILKANCPKGDELHAEEILREARGQFIRESDAAEYDGSYVEDHCPECNQSKSECICDEECTCAERSWYGPEHDSACVFAGEPREAIRCARCGAQGEHIAMQALVSGTPGLACCDPEIPYNCPRCGRFHESTEFEDEGTGDEAGRTFRYCSEHCKEAH